MTDRFEDVMLPPEFRKDIDFAVARRSTDQTSVRRQCVRGGDGRDCDIDALFAFMRLQNGVEHVGDARQTLLTFVRLIEKRILDANRAKCSKWVAKQLVGGDGVLKPQEPMPLRVIWSAEGPRTDPSMFSRAPDET